MHTKLARAEPTTTSETARSRNLLQRKCACGGASGPTGECAACRRKTSLGGTLQRKLRINQPGDVYEQEADRVADQVMRMAEPNLQRQAEEEEDEEELLQTKPLVQRRVSGGTGNGDAPSIVHDVLRSPGQPLDSATRSFMEARFGHNFSQVRVHTHGKAAESAAAVNARAYTVGQNVVFGQGEYVPTTTTGHHLIAHELTHVIQQRSADVDQSSVGPNALVQRQNGDSPPAAETTPASPDVAAGGEASPAPFTEVRPSERERVLRIVISCNDMRLRLETATTIEIYTLDECTLPVGSYYTPVTVTGEDFFLDFSAALSAEEEFSFRYRVEPDQENPADYLREQATVHVDVVERLPLPRPTEEQRQQPQCIRIDDRILVPADSFSRNLFEPISFRQTIWTHPVPLGQFGWVEVDATASGNLSGRFSARYGPGRLTDICLLYLVDRQGSSAPIEHPLLGSESRADVTTYRIGGRARFTLPARATIRIGGEGRLRIAGDYLSVIEVAAAEGALSASGEAILAGEINGMVEVIAQATRSAATLDHPIYPLQVTIENSTLDDVDLSAEIGLRGRAGLTFRVDLSAGFDLLGFNLWRQTWNLVNFNAGVSWRGGFKYSPNPGLHWDLGTLGVDDEMDLGPAEDEGLNEIDFHEEAAAVEEEDVIEAILNETHAQVTAPDGLNEDNALPFDWYKPIELYPETIAIPLADEPHELHRDDGPTTVRYQQRGRTRFEQLGVADWPAVHRTFEYFPYDERRTPEQARFNRLLDRLGYSRSGVDAEHVWDVKLRGLSYDRFDNLWPASNQDQQLAGTRHNRQIRNYERTLGNIAGRWFEIVRVLHPA